MSESIQQIERQLPESGNTVSVFSGGEAFAAAQRMAKALTKSSLMPKEYQGDQGLPNTLIAMELASRIGASVVMVAQNLDVIHGRPSWRAQFLIATVNACGRFSSLRFREHGEPGRDSWGFRAVARELKTDEELVGPLITIGMAKAEGWYGKNGSKWKTMPELMLCYRAAAFWTRLNAPELSLGLQTDHEVIDTWGTAVPDQIRPGDPKELEARLCDVEISEAEERSPIEPSVDVDPAPDSDREPGMEG